MINARGVLPRVTHKKEVYIMTEKASETVFRRVNKNKWEEVYHTENAASVYEKVARCLLAKYVHKCTWITRIIDNNNYTGTRTLRVYTDNGYMYKYIIAD